MARHRCWSAPVAVEPVTEGASSRHQGGQTHRASQQQQHQHRLQEQQQECPSTLPDALRVFFTHPSVVLALAVISGHAAFRATCGPLTLVDAAVALASVALWLFQEWAIHKYLLHSPFDWLGKQIHETHHRQPYHHVSIDGPEVVGAFMLLAGCVLFALVQPWAGAGPAATACVSYYLAGLLSYQLVHMLVHTRWVPKNPLVRRMRRTHMLHHLRNHQHWFAFSLPAMDEWFGTSPNPASVPLNSFSQKQP